MYYYLGSKQSVASDWPSGCLLIIQSYSLLQKKPNLLYQYCPLPFSLSLLPLLHYTTLYYLRYTTLYYYTTLHYRYYTTPAH